MANDTEQGQAAAPSRKGILDDWTPEDHAEEAEDRIRFALQALDRAEPLLDGFTKIAKTRGHSAEEAYGMLLVLAGIIKRARNELSGDAETL